MEEQRTERGPMKIANLERLREELEQLGRNVGRTPKAGNGAQEQEEPQVLTIRGR